MSILAKLRSTQKASMVNGVLTLSAADLIVKPINGKDYEFFAIGNSVLTLKAIDNGIAKGAITVEENGDAIVIKLVDGHQMVTTDSNFIGFGAITKMVTAADLLA